MERVKAKAKETKQVEVKKAERVKAKAKAKEMIRVIFKKAKSRRN